MLVTACNGFKSIKTVFKELSPHEKYVESLKKAELLNASMAKSWLEASESVFDDSVFVRVPFSESGFFSASSPDARSYRFEVKDGQVLTVKATLRVKRDANIFLDVFQHDEGDWERVAFADSTLAITYEFDSNQECVLRLQPELLVNAWYTIDIALTPVLINPVYGATNKSIGSFYGAPRDNGRRSHEGVDIFARKGTPVIAPTDGVITRVGENTLGGKVVWMRDLKRRHSYYFAHLDSQMVQPGMRVYQGHVLGLVGNTGNAKKTPPHLHFGIYQSGSKDQLHYIRQMEAAVLTLPIDTAFHQKPFRTRLRSSALRVGPSLKLPAKAMLHEDTYVTVIGQSSEWYRVILPDETQGFLPKQQLAPLVKGKQTVTDSAAVLFSTVHTDAVPITTLPAKTKVEVLARFQQYRFVVTGDGQAGWITGEQS
jgi:murein DD-endopeptidase MepM/ murein hydrolase activator NlpD